MRYFTFLYKKNSGGNSRQNRKFGKMLLLPIRNVKNARCRSFENLSPCNFLETSFLPSYHIHISLELIPDPDIDFYIAKGSLICLFVIAPLMYIFQRALFPQFVKRWNFPSYDTSTFMNETVIMKVNPKLIYSYAD